MCVCCFCYRSSSPHKERRKMMMMMRGLRKLNRSAMTRYNNATKSAVRWMAANPMPPTTSSPNKRTEEAVNNILYVVVDSFYNYRLTHSKSKPGIMFLSTRKRERITYFPCLSITRLVF